MSRAEPMDPESRRAFYTMQLGVIPGAARQARRAWHKELRASGEHEPVDGWHDMPPAERPKGRPTPRRADAIAARRQGQATADWCSYCESPHPEGTPCARPGRDHA